MKAVLIEELDSGIPQAPEVASMGASSTSGEEQSSKYQQMLAKAKAAKAAKSA